MQSSGEAAGDGGSPHTALELRTDLWLFALAVSGFSPLQRAGGADLPVSAECYGAWEPQCLGAPFQGSSMQKLVVFRGLQPLFNKSHVLI